MCTDKVPGIIEIVVWFGALNCSVTLTLEGLCHIFITMAEHVCVHIQINSLGPVVMRYYVLSA